MSINVKKYTKDQMAKMVEETEENSNRREMNITSWLNSLNPKKKEIVELKSVLVKKNLTISSLKAENAALTEQVSQMNDEAINKVNEIANLKADADVLRNKLTDTEASLGRANACIATMQVEKDQQTNELFEWQGTAQALHDDLLDARDHANYAEAHPWRNLWAWVKRKVARHE